jgi:hypothetical protein
MDENTSKSLNQLVLALKSLSKSVEKSLYHGRHQGVGDMVAKSYRSLHARAVELLPDDFYVRDVLVLEPSPETSDKEKLSQAHLQVSQLTDYLESLLKAERRVDFSAEVGDWKEFGRDLSEQIISMTRTTLKRAISNIDVGTNPPPPPTPPPPGVPPAGAPPWAQPFTPPTPPQPPMPPTPPPSTPVTPPGRVNPSSPPDEPMTPPGALTPTGSPPPGDDL